MFEKNGGQLDPDVKFSLQTGPGVTFFTPSEIVMSLATGTGLNERESPKPSKAAHLATVRMRFPSANPAPTVTGEDRLSTVTNHLSGTDQTRWKTLVPNFARIRYHQVYPGIDVVFHAGKKDSRRLEYDFLVAPGADPTAIRLSFSGARASLDQNGSLVLRTSAGIIRQDKPTTYQLAAGGNKKLVTSKFRMGTDRRTVSFVTGPYDKTRTLVIDPTFSSSIATTYLGVAGQSTYGNAIAVDSEGSTFIAGLVPVPGFPHPTYDLSPGVWGPGYHTRAFVAKFSPDLTKLVYVTILGGSKFDLANALALDRTTGNVFVAGTTASTDFRTTAGAFQSTFPGNQYAPFLAVLSPDGSSLIYSTFLNGQSNTAYEDTANGVAVDERGKAYLTGSSSATDFPIKAAPGKTALKADRGGSGSVAFVAKIDPSATGQDSLVSSTYLGNPTGAGWAVVASDSGKIYVGGTTGKNLATTQGAFQEKFGGGAFIAVLDTELSAPAYVSYVAGALGGTVYAIAVDRNDDIHLGGINGPPSTKHPVGTNSPDETAEQAEGPVWVAMLHPGARGLLDLVYSVHFGFTPVGGVSQAVRGIGVDQNLNTYVSGVSFNKGVPLTADGTDDQVAANFKGFLTVLNPDGSAYVYSTYLTIGGQGGSRALALQPCSESVFVTGDARGELLQPPAPDAYQTSPIGNGGDVFVASFFRKMKAPTLESITPNKGPVSGLPGVVIKGECLGPATQVSFGDVAVPAGDFKVNGSGTQLTVTAPPHAPGIVQVTVTNPAGVSNSLPFEYLADPLAVLPVLTGVTPACGSLGKSTHVALKGTGLAANSTVEFQGVGSVAGGSLVGGSLEVDTPVSSSEATVALRVTTPGLGTSALAGAPKFTYSDACQGAAGGGGGQPAPPTAPQDNTASNASTASSNAKAPAPPPPPAPPGGAPSAVPVSSGAPASSAAPGSGAAPSGTSAPAQVATPTLVSGSASAPSSAASGAQPAAGLVPGAQVAPESAPRYAMVARTGPDWMPGAVMFAGFLLLGSCQIALRRRREEAVPAPAVQVA